MPAEALAVGGNRLVQNLRAVSIGSVATYPCSTSKGQDDSDEARQSRWMTQAPPRIAIWHYSGCHQAPLPSEACTSLAST
jgi:hypothetical protein